MSQPYALLFGPWVPDKQDASIGLPQQYAPSEVPLADCLNVYWSDQGYRSLNALANQGTAMASQCFGAATVIDTSDALHIYAGNASDLFHWSGTAWTNVSKSAGAYSGSTNWSFVPFAGCVVAANGLNVLQDVTIGGGNFADISGAPTGNVLGVINQFLMVGDLTSFPYRVQWSGIGDPTSWPTPLTDAAIAVQSSYEDLDQSFGRVMFIAGGPQLGVIFQQLGITRATYAGGDVVFQFAPFERKRGLVARGAAVQVGDLTHFLASDGFYVTDGSQVIPTGSSTDDGLGLDKWFWSNVNQSALSTIRAGYDSTLKCLAFAVPTGANTRPDTLLLLNPRDQRWTRASVSSEMLWSDISSPSGPAIQHRLGFVDQSHKLAYLTGAAPSGYCETYDGGFVDTRIRDVVEARPDIVCTGTPTMRVGVRNSLQDSIVYSADNSPDSFSRHVTWDPPPAGRYVRVRVTSSSASAINGATIFTEMGGLV